MMMNNSNGILRRKKKHFYIITWSMAKMCHTQNNFLYCKTLSVRQSVTNPNCGRRRMFFFFNTCQITSFKILAFSFGLLSYGTLNFMWYSKNKFFFCLLANIIQFLTRNSNYEINALNHVLKSFSLCFLSFNITRSQIDLAHILKLIKKQIAFT